MQYFREPLQSIFLLKKIQKGGSSASSTVYLASPEINNAKIKIFLKVIFEMVQQELLGKMAFTTMPLCLEKMTRYSADTGSELKMLKSDES